jgi:ABC-type lipoprotein export system ATPase subunit
MKHKFEQGSIWRKWDLHVHTPASLINHYGNNNHAWDKFLDDLEALPPEFSVIGINDYLFIDGYERILQERESNGRLENINEIFPVIEFRLDKFAGAKKLKRVNFHVIFSPEIKPDIIQQHFLAAIPRHYKLTPKGKRHENTWQALATKESLKELGNLIKGSVPDDKLKDFGCDLEEGFNNINFDHDEIIEVLNKSHYLRDKYLTAIGKTEWYDIEWNDHSIADKKNIINDVDLVFTAAETTEGFIKSRNQLLESKVNSHLLDCSDAHYFSESSDKDRLGNCLTWIKADPTFTGLKHTLDEYNDRVFVGERPPKLVEIDTNQPRYIREITIEPDVPKVGANAWFSDKIPLNPGLIAVIGRKGSGKSALADIMALAGGSHVNPDDYPFLNKNRFRKKQLAKDYKANLLWYDASTSPRNLQEPIDVDTDSEQVKYLPQGNVESICNEAGVSVVFQKEINKVVFSYVSDEDKLMRGELDELIKYKTGVIEDEIARIRGKLSKEIENSLTLEDKTDDKYTKQTENKLREKQRELAALKLPKEVDQPLTELDINTQMKIENLASRINELSKNIDELNAQNITDNAQIAKIDRIKGKLKEFVEQSKDITEEIESDCLELGLKVSDLLSLEIKYEKIDALRKKIKEDIKGRKLLLIDHEVTTLGDDERDNGNTDLLSPLSLIIERETARTVIKSIRDNLDAKHKEYQEYLRDKARIEKSKKEIIGTDEDDSKDTIKSLKAELQYIKKNLNNDLNESYNKLYGFTEELFDSIKSKILIYESIYEPLRDFVASERQRQQSAESVLDFDVRIIFERENFIDVFLSFIDQTRSGYFRGIRPGTEKLRDLTQRFSLNSKDDVITMIEKIIFTLKHGSGIENLRIENQLTSGEKKQQELYEYLFGLKYIDVKYTILFNQKDLNLNEFSPGEKGAVLLIFYLLIDKEKSPLIIDQPEENLDNESVYSLLVPYVRMAKEKRQVIMVTHNPNLAVVCDAEQIIHASMNKVTNEIRYKSGSIENPELNKLIVDVLEGTMPAFRTRDNRYIDE